MFHMDHLGTTRHMTDSTGAAGEASVYTAFGMLRSGTAHGYGYDGAWGYRSDLADSASSGGSGDPVTDPRLGFPFLHVGHRYFDPSTGRFLQRDPIGIYGGINVYNYVNSSPTAGIDPLGLQDRNTAECQDQCEVWGGPGMDQQTRKNAYASCNAMYWPPPPARQPPPPGYTPWPSPKPPVKVPRAPMPRPTGGWSGKAVAVLALMMLIVLAVSLRESSVTDRFRFLQ
jgi:RHS repeat-associated protein